MIWPTLLRPPPWPVAPISSTSGYGSDAPRRVADRSGGGGRHPAAFSLTPSEVYTRPLETVHAIGIRTVRRGVCALIITIEHAIRAGAVSRA